VLGLVLTASLGLGGCSRAGAGGSTRHTGSGTASAASSRPAPSVKDGHLTFTLLSLRCGLGAVAGTHSEGTPEGQYCQGRLRVLNADPESHTYLARRQLIAGVDAAHAKPSSFAMAVRRQLDEVPIGGHDLIEVEVWYDVPKGAHVTGLRVGGDRDQMGFMDTSIVPYAKGGAFLPMTPTT
jgi:hypothetical protein